MSISDQIRKALRECGEPMSIADIANALSWDKATKDQAHTLAGQMRRRGELTSKLEEGKAVFAIVDSYVPVRRHAGGRPKKTIESKTEKAVAPAVETIATPPPAIADEQVSEEAAAALQTWSMKRALVKRTDLNLHMRLDSIASDVEDALTDAFEAGVDRRVIRSLINASSSINRAARAYSGN